MCFQVNRVFGAEFGVTGLAAGREGRIPPWRPSAGAWARRAEPQGLGWGGALRGAEGAGLGPRLPHPRPSGPPGRLPETSREQWPPPGSRLGLRPGDLGLSLPGIGDLDLQAPAGWAAYPIPGLERGLTPSRPDVRGPSGGVWGGRECVRRASSSLPGGPSPLFPPSCFPSPDGAPPLAARRPARSRGVGNRRPSALPRRNRGGRTDPTHSSTS